MPTQSKQWVKSIKTLFRLLMSWVKSFLKEEKKFFLLPEQYWKNFIKFKKKLSMKRFLTFVWIMKMDMWTDHRWLLQSLKEIRTHISFLKMILDHQTFQRFRVIRTILTKYFYCLLTLLYLLINLLIIQLLLVSQSELLLLLWFHLRSLKPQMNYDNWL